MAMDINGLKQFLTKMSDSEFMAMSKAVQDEAQRRRVAVHVTQITQSINKHKPMKTTANKKRVKMP